jgi:hypothetical protein
MHDVVMSNQYNKMLCCRIKRIRLRLCRFFLTNTTGACNEIRIDSCIFNKNPYYVSIKGERGKVYPYITKGLIFVFLCYTYKFTDYNKL